MFMRVFVNAVRNAAVGVTGLITRVGFSQLVCESFCNGYWQR